MPNQYFLGEILGYIKNHMFLIIIGIYTENIVMTNIITNKYI